MASGYHSLIIWACWSRGARSEVPDTLVPTVPVKSAMFSATPYSVMEVPSTGMVSVADAAAWSGAVALAIIRSTLLDTKPLIMVAQVGVSPAAFWFSMST